MDSIRAAMKTGQVDASVTSMESAYPSAKKKGMDFHENSWRCRAPLSRARLFRA